MTFSSINLKSHVWYKYVTRQFGQQSTICLSLSLFAFLSHNAGFSTNTFWGLVLLAGGIFWRKILFGLRVNWRFAHWWVVVLVMCRCLCRWMVRFLVLGAVGVSIMYKTNSPKDLVVPFQSFFPFHWTIVTFLVLLSHPIVLQCSRKITIKTQLSLINDTQQCYMFWFPRNHHQTFHTKHLKYVSPSYFFLHLSEISLNFF